MSAEGCRQCGRPVDEAVGQITEHDPGTTSGYISPYYLVITCRPCGCTWAEFATATPTSQEA